MGIFDKIRGTGHKSPKIKTADIVHYLQKLESLARTNIKQGNLKEAEEKRTKVIQLAERLLPPEAIAIGYNNRGHGYSHQGDHTRAIKDFDKALELTPNSAKIYINRGAAYVGKKNYDLGIKDYDKAIEIDPTSVSTYNNRGLAYSLKGDGSQALANFNRAIDIDPKCANAFFNRSVIYAAMEKVEQARSDLNEAVRLKYPDATKIHSLRQRLNDMLEKRSAHPKQTKNNQRELKMEETSKELKRVQELYDEIQTLKKNSLHRDKTFAKCNEFIDMLEKLPAPPHMIALGYNVRAEILISEKREYDRGIKDINMAIKLNPNYAFAYFTRGFAYWFKGEHEKALQDWDKACELDPEQAPFFQKTKEKFQRLQELTEGARRSGEFDKIFKNES